MNYKNYTIILTLFLLTDSTPALDTANFWEEYGSNAEGYGFLEESRMLGLQLEQDLLGYQVPSGYLSPSPDSLHLPMPPQYLLTARTAGDEFYGQLFRLRAAYAENWNAGFVLECDPGEEWDDFHAGYISRKTDNLHFVAGNYALGAAQGLVIWQGFDWGAYPENPTAPAKSDFLRGYVSTDENRALFGGALRGSYRKWRIMAGYSDARLDASENENGIGSIQPAGIHITDTEKENKDRLHDRSIIGRVKYEWSPDYSLGVTMLSESYNPAFASGDSIRQTFNFSGSNLTATGVDFRGQYSDLTLEGELAGTNAGGSAGIARCLINQENAAVSLAYLKMNESYDNFRSLYSGGNIEQFVFGISLKPWKNAKFNLLYDSFKRPWRTYFEKMPPQGIKYSLQIEQKIGTRTVSARIRRTRSGSGIDDSIRDQYRLDFSSNAKWGRYGFRAEAMSADDNDDSNLGILLSALLNLKLARGQIVLKIAGFQIPDYDCRIYQYEYDVPGRILIPFYYGNGVAFNSVYTLRMRSGLTVSLKAGYTHYDWRPAPADSNFDRNFALYLNYSGNFSFR